MEVNEFSIIVPGKLNNVAQFRSSKVSHNDALRDERWWLLSRIRANNNNTDAENSQNDHDCGFLDSTRGKVTHLMFYNITQVHLLSEAHFGNPTFWANAYEEIHSLAPHNIIDPFILDFYISTGVLSTQTSMEAYYLDQVMIKDIVRNCKITNKVRDLIAPGTTGTLPMHPIPFLHTPAQHLITWFFWTFPLGRF